MKDNETNKQQFAQFGRLLSLVFTRSFMYQANHPYLLESIDSLQRTLDQVLNTFSPLTFILNREQFYVDEEPLDPRINVDRMVTHFKKTGIESVSFYKGLGKNELDHFLEILTSLNSYPNAESMKTALFKKGVSSIKINHVFYQKMSIDDEVVARDVLKKVTPQFMDETQIKTKQMFMDTVLESVLVEEFVKTLNLKSLINSPSGLSKNMIAADLKMANRNESVDLRPGVLLLQQLEAIEQEVEKNLSEESNPNLSELASALFSMRNELIDGIEAQKALGIAYSNEETIFDKANEITDRILIKLIKEEYKAGQITVARLALILRRLIPEANDLKRLLPKIKTALLEEGMSLSDFMSLIQELGRELQNEGLASILSAGSEEIGIDGENLIQAVKENPVQTAELIYLASEIRKGGGDEKALTDLLVDYVEKVGSKLSRDMGQEQGLEGEQHLQKVVTEVKSNMLQHLEKLDIKEDILNSLEEKINQRMDAVLDKMRLEWIKAQSHLGQNEQMKQLTVLETLECSVDKEEELGEILKIIRTKVDSREIDENDFGQIYAEIVIQDRLKKAQQDRKGLITGILRSQGLMNLLNKEIARAKRYGTPLSALGFSLVKVTAKNKPEPGAFTNHDVIDAVLDQLAYIFRTSDVVGELKKNKLVALLPMTPQGEAKLALRRAMKFLHLKPMIVKGMPLEIKLAGIVADIDFKNVTNASLFAERLTDQLRDMSTRIRNIHAY